MKIAPRLAMTAGVLLCIGTVIWVVVDWRQGSGGFVAKPFIEGASAFFPGQEQRLVEYRDALGKAEASMNSDYATGRWYLTAGKWASWIAGAITSVLTLFAGLRGGVVASGRGEDGDSTAVQPPQAKGQPAAITAAAADLMRRKLSRRAYLTIAVLAFIATLANFFGSQFKTEAQEARDRAEEKHAKIAQLRVDAKSGTADLDTIISELNRVTQW